MYNSTTFFCIVDFCRISMTIVRGSSQEKLDFKRHAHLLTRLETIIRQYEYFQASFDNVRTSNLSLFYFYSHCWMKCRHPRYFHLNILEISDAFEKWHIDSLIIFTRKFLRLEREEAIPLITEYNMQHFPIWKERSFRIELLHPAQ